MPRPNPNSYPKHQRWRFLQRQMSDSDLRKFASAIVSCDGLRVDDCVGTLLGFLNPQSNSPAYLKDLWLAIAVNMMQQQGLGCTFDDGRFVQATDLARLVQETGDVDGYWYYWALRFQYPFAYPKHNHYISNGVAVQPAVLLLQHLVDLYALSGSFAEAYLDRNEIVAFLMASRDHSTVASNCNAIRLNRFRHYAYTAEGRVSGFAEAGEHFFDRGRLFLGKCNLLAFQPGRVVLRNQTHLDRVTRFLSRTRPPERFLENTADARNLFFSHAYDDLEPEPALLYEFVNGSRPTALGPTPLSPTPALRPPSGRRPSRRHARSAPTSPVNPLNLEGTFAEGNTLVRRFQAALRGDLLRLYGSRCCVCGLDLEPLLITSHIVPVKVDRLIAADRRNALLLCVLHDKAFEEGLFGIGPSYQVVVHPNVLSATHQLLVSEVVGRAGSAIRLPPFPIGGPDLRPLPDYLERHRKLHGLP